jgi:hypothetical protein
MYNNYLLNIKNKVWAVLHIGLVMLVLDSIGSATEKIPPITQVVNQVQKKKEISTKMAELNKEVDNNYKTDASPKEKVKTVSNIYKISSDLTTEKPSLKESRREHILKSRAANKTFSEVVTNSKDIGEIIGKQMEVIRKKESISQEDIDRAYSSMPLSDAYSEMRITSELGASGLIPAISLLLGGGSTGYDLLFGLKRNKRMDEMKKIGIFSTIGAFFGALSSIGLRKLGYFNSNLEKYFKFDSFIIKNENVDFGLSGALTGFSFGLLAYQVYTKVFCYKKKQGYSLKTKILLGAVAFVFLGVLAFYSTIVGFYDEEKESGFDE